jgi:hypothetical protein
MRTENKQRFGKGSSGQSRGSVVMSCTLALQERTTGGSTATLHTAAAAHAPCIAWRVVAVAGPLCGCTHLRCVPPSLAFSLLHLRLYPWFCREQRIRAVAEAAPWKLCGNEPHMVLPPDVAAGLSWGLLAAGSWYSRRPTRWLKVRMRRLM